MTPTVQQVRPLLKYINRHEAPKGYDQIWGGISKEHYPSKRLTRMTIREVLAWQDSIDHLYMSEASGGYQFMEDTLRDIYAPAGFSLDDKFDEDAQDALAVYLLKQKGLKKYLMGGLTPEAFANRVAHVWASLPLVSGPGKGRGVYDGDGLNKAVKDVSGYLRAVKAIRRPSITTPVRQPFWRWILNLLKSLIHKRK